jgi:hypothetical protein
MIWLIINGQSELYGSQDEGLAALVVALNRRRELACTITPDGPPAHGVEYKAQHPNNGFELICLTDEEPQQSEGGQEC